MAIEYQVSLTAVQIETALKNAVLKSEQTLSDDEKAQARANIGITKTTTADNGKFLRVVNGVPTWTTVTAAEGVSF